MNLDPNIREHYDIATALRGPDLDPVNSLPGPTDADTQQWEQVTKHLKFVLTARLRSLVGMHTGLAANVRPRAYLEPPTWAALQAAGAFLGEHPEQAYAYLGHYLYHTSRGFRAWAALHPRAAERDEALALGALAAELWTLATGNPTTDLTFYQQALADLRKLPEVS